MTMNVGLRILGALEIVSDGAGRSVTRGHQERIYAMLVGAAGRHVPADALARTLWGERPPRNAERALQPEVSRLRRLLAPAGAAIRYGSGGYTLECAADRIDVLSFETLAARGRRALRDGDATLAAATLTEALGLWRGPAYAHLAGEPFDTERRRLDEQCLAARIALAEARLALGEHADLVAGLEMLAGRHPLHEDLTRQLILALYRSGRQSEAMAVYHRLRRSLAEELGQPPSADLVTLYEQVLVQDRRLDWTAPAGARVWCLPPDNPKFCGRDGLLRELAASLSPSGVVALHGLPGIGKTQLALAYAHRQDLPVVWWCPAENPDVVDVSLAWLAAELGIGVAGDVDRTRIALRRALAERDGWLIVFDNAERLDHIRTWLPSTGAGQVLITSRNPDWEGYAKSVAVPPFTLAESTAFLLRRTGHVSAKAEALADRLGHLPLALEQASAFCMRTGETLAAYLQFLDQRAGELLARGQTSDYDGTVATTWQIAFQRVEADDPGAVDVLRACAYLAADDVPMTLLSAAVPRLADPLRLADAIGALMRYSLVDRQGPALSVHRLVQDLVRTTVSDADRRATLDALVAALARAAPVDPQAMPLWPEWDRYVPHIGAVLGHLDALDHWPESLGDLISRTAVHLDERGAYLAASRLLNIALGLAGRARPADSLLRARLLTELGRVLDRSGCEMHGARDLLYEALGILESTPETSALAVGRTLSRLAHALHCADLLTDALDVHGRAVPLLREAGDRRELAHGLTDYGFSLWQTKDLPAARRAFAEAIELFEAELGDTHPDVAAARSGLGVVLQDDGRLDEAGEQYERALAVLVAAHPDAGEAHPDIAQTLDKLGYLLRLTGDVAGATDCHERAVAALHQLFGAHDPRVAMALSNLGLDQLTAGAVADALRSQERAMAIFTETYGEEHSSTLMAAARRAAVAARIAEVSR
jgi:DNA-binding SARP family transcriptional activator/tetratricopeptide (TPR) repeat protein